MGKSKRRSERFAIHRLTHLAFDKEAYVDADAVNISKSGLLCLVEEAISVARKVFLTVDIHAAGMGSFGCEGNVVRCEQQPDNYFEVAINFTDVEAAGKAALATLEA
jgi:hypothetical protein